MYSADLSNVMHLLSSCELQWEATQRVTTAKILGVHRDKHLTWADHVTTFLLSCYAALAVLRKLRNLASG